MKDLSIIQYQAELEEKVGNEQQLRKELSMVAQDNDAKHGDVNSRQEAYQEDDNLKLRNESIQEYKELHEQIQELIKLLQTETTHFVKTNEQSLKQAKSISIDIGKICEKGLCHASEHFT